MLIDFLYERHNLDPSHLIRLHIDDAYDELKKDFTDEQITKSEDEDGNLIHVLK